MDVDGFWMGAAEVARRVPLAGLVAENGGWERFRDPAQWRRAGLSPALCSRWKQGRSARTRGRALTLVDDAYPEALRVLPDAPPVLFVEGEVEALSQRALAVVGTRAATVYGRQTARDLGQRLARAGWCVVSGLARGIDGEAHRGALSSGTTVAVLAHGLDHTSPTSHGRLRRSIVEQGGALVTTWPDGVPGSTWRFPLRNRWIAGLAQAVVVVEAGQRSGAIHTVRAATDYGREVFAVPGAISSPASVGCNRLLSEGATPVVSVEGLLEALGSPEGEVSWVDRLVGGASLVDVARARGSSVDELLETIAMMEALGELTRLPGSRYARRG